MSKFTQFSRYRLFISITIAILTLQTVFAQDVIPVSGTGSAIIISNLQESQCFAAAPGMLAAAPPTTVSRLVGFSPCNLTEPLQTWEIVAPPNSAAGTLIIRLFGTGFCIATNGAGKQISLASCSTAPVQVFAFTQFASNGRQLYVINNTGSRACLEGLNLGTGCPVANTGTVSIPSTLLFEFRLSNAPGTNRVVTLTPVTTAALPTVNETVVTVNTTTNAVITATATNTRSVTLSASPIKSQGSVSPHPDNNNNGAIVLSSQTLTIALISVSGIALIAFAVAIFFIVRSRKRKQQRDELERRTLSRYSKSSSRLTDVDDYSIATKSLGRKGGPPWRVDEYPMPPPPTGLMKRNGSKNSGQNDVRGSYPLDERNKEPVYITPFARLERQNSFQTSPILPPIKKPRDMYSEIDGGEYSQLQPPLNRKISDRAYDVDESVVGGASAISRLRGTRERQMANNPPKPKVIIPTVAPSVISEALPSPTSTEGGYIHAPSFGNSDPSPKFSASMGKMVPNLDAPSVVIEEEEDDSRPEDSVSRQDDAMSQDSAFMNTPVRSQMRGTTKDALSQRSSSLGFPIQSAKSNLRSKRLNTTGPASIFDVLSEVGVDVKSVAGSSVKERERLEFWDNATQTGTQTVDYSNNRLSGSTNSTDDIINTVARANAYAFATVASSTTGTSIKRTSHPAALSPTSIQFTHADDDLSDVSKKPPLEIATVIWPYSSENDDELLLDQGDLIIILNRFDDGWARGWSKKSKRTGFFPLAAVTTQAVGSSAESIRNHDDGFKSESQISPVTENHPSPNRSEFKSEIDYGTELGEEEVENRVFGGNHNSSIVFVHQNNSRDLQQSQYHSPNTNQNRTGDGRIPPHIQLDENDLQINDEDLSSPVPPYRSSDKLSPGKYGKDLSRSSSQSSSLPSLFQMSAHSTVERSKQYANSKLAEANKGW